MLEKEVLPMRDISHLTQHYDAHYEDARFASRHGRVEFLTTMEYILRYATPDCRILEIGAGTGKYSHALARLGYHVDAVELVQSNIDIFTGLTQPGEDVTIRQGDALDLSFLPDNSYDIVLLLGPMYHLYEDEQKLRALSEALRVTKRGGILFTAYCVADTSIIEFGFVRGNILGLIEKGLVDPVTFEAFSTPAEVFELCRKSDIDAYMANFNAERLHYVATDLFTHSIGDAVDAMTDEVFEIYLRYHLAICERPDLVGATNHSLDIVRKL
jgi:SAM-dependent methyltransferase